jgi:hypothetical protein
MLRSRFECLFAMALLTGPESEQSLGEKITTFDVQLENEGEKVKPSFGELALMYDKPRSGLADLPINRL